MECKSKRPAVTGHTLGDSGENRTQSSVGRRLRKNTKIYRVAKALAQRSFNRFEAERLLADHCLPSTVSAIQSLGVLGVVVARKTEQVSGFMGASTVCSRYWIAEDQRERLEAVLGLSK